MYTTFVSTSRNTFEVHVSSRVLAHKQGRLQPTALHFLEVQKLFWTPQNCLKSLFS